MAEFSSLAGLLPALNQTMNTLGAVNRAVDGVGSIIGNSKAGRELRDRQEQASNQLAERQKLEEQIATQNAMRDRAVLNAQATESERVRLTALKRAVAKQRAQYGSAGIDDDGGSGEAVLLGLFDQSQQEQAADDNVYQLRLQAIDDNLGAIRATNLLEAAQRAEKDRLNRFYA